jgi:hypothetical protein
MDLGTKLWACYSIPKKSMHSKGSLRLKRLKIARRATRKSKFLLSTEIDEVQPLVVMEIMILRTSLLILNSLVLAKLI